MQRGKAGPWPSLVLIAAYVAASPNAAVRAQPKETAKPFVVESYYKAKWGHFDEFLRLFKKNHYPLLKKEMELGRIIRLDAVRPLYHGSEVGRWDLRVTIAWRDAATAHDDLDPGRLVPQLFPDKTTYDREEQRRFELLLEHWDIPLQEAPLDR